MQLVCSAQGQQGWGPQATKEAESQPPPWASRGAPGPHWAGAGLAKWHSGSGQAGTHAGGREGLAFPSPSPHRPPKVALNQFVESNLSHSFHLFKN